jgi:hypothetical protein
MAARYPSPRRVKLHHVYTVEELALTLGKHKHTIRRWIAEGLRTIDGRRPTMIRGADARAFLESQRSSRRRRCGPAEMYCFKCRAPKSAAGDIADLEITTATTGRLIGICPDCSTLMHRAVNPTKIDHLRTVLQVAVRTAPTRIADSSNPKLNVDLEGLPQS